MLMYVSTVNSQSNFILKGKKDGLGFKKAHLTILIRLILDLIDIMTMLCGNTYGFGVLVYQIFAKF